MLRLLHRDPNQKKEQAHVYIPKTTRNSSELNQSPPLSTAKFISNETLDPIISIEKTGKQKKGDGIQSLIEQKKQADDVAHFENEKEYKKITEKKKSNVFAEQPHNCFQEEVKIQYVSTSNCSIINLYSFIFISLIIHAKNEFEKI